MTTSSEDVLPQMGEIPLKKWEPFEGKNDKIMIQKNTLSGPILQNRKSTHRLKKRGPHKTFRRETDFYISGKSNFVVQIKQVLEKLNEHGEVFLHCLGNALTRGINLALTVAADAGSSVRFEVNTSTIELNDDLHPLTDSEDFGQQKRINSCIHIRLFRLIKAI